MAAGLNPEVAAKVAEAATEASKGTWTPGTYALYAILALLVPCAIALMRYVPTMQRLKDAADTSLRSDLMEEVRTLRQELRAEQADCARRTTGMQNKMDAIVRQFVSFQIIVARNMPDNNVAVSAQAASERLMEVVAKPIEDFIPPEMHPSDVGQECESDRRG